MIAFDDQEIYILIVDRVIAFRYIIMYNARCAVGENGVGGGQPMVQMLIRLPDALKEVLQKEARRKGMSLNALVLQIL